MNNVILRKIKEDDLETFSKLFSDELVMEYSEGIISPEHIPKWFAKVTSQYNANDGFGTFSIVLVESDSVIGYCSLLQTGYIALPEIGYRIFPNYWGKGLATEATRQIIKYAFEEMGLPAIYAQVDPNNHRSVCVLKKLNMSYSHEIKPDGYNYADQIWVLER